MWSNELQQLTCEALEGKGNFVPRTGAVYFKSDNRFAEMSLADYLANKLHLTDRSTGEIYAFHSVNELLNAGWVLD
ncbi:MAG: hypothetical protein Q7S87_11705 [Agitococcus sp.]|nr:hypothetical protein [Agitococcus sp.]